MELKLLRQYFPSGTNGKLYYNGRVLCYTIELPWRNNASRISCIPEGRYRIRTRYSLKFNKHLLLENVSQRALILIHPANDAMKELKGCIAPVSRITGEGKGAASRVACRALFALVVQHIDKEAVYITIKKEINERSEKALPTNTTFL